MRKNQAFSRIESRVLSVSCALIFVFSAFFFPGAVLAGYGAARWNSPQSQGGYANLYIA